ncbi:hypothetical protein JW835_12695 [bacterium]|nr:hypothetical protein [bacterium]
MKSKKLGLLILSLLFLCLFMVCSNDKDPASYVDSYEDQVAYKESVGTTHQGDFFPLNENYTCYYLGNMIADYKMEIKGFGSNEDTMDEPIYGEQKVLGIRNIPLPSGTVPLYPIVDTMDMDSDTSRFFMKDQTAVYIKAIKMSNGEYLEIEDPVFFKSTLVVGDSWKTAPRADMTKLLEGEMGDEASGSDLSMNAEAKFFVVGEETINLPIGYRKAVRLEQANDIVLKGNLVDSGMEFDIKIDAKLAVEYHVIADTGIVHQNVTGPMNMSMSGAGMSIVISMDIQQCDLKLTGITGGAGTENGLLSLAKPAAPGKRFAFRSDREEKMWKLSQRIAKMLIRQLTL